VIEIHRSVVVAEPACAARARREEPALASFHPLLLAVCRRTRRFPDGDPIELGLGIRAAALSAAEAVLAGCELRGLPVGFATALVEAVRRLRELAYCIEIARRLGYLSDRSSAELLALHARTLRAVSTLAGDAQARQPHANREGALVLVGAREPAA
jgi:four helix bundle protein